MPVDWVERDFRSRYACTGALELVMKLREKFSALELRQQSIFSCKADCSDKFLGEQRSQTSQENLSEDLSKNWEKRYGI